MLSAEGDSGDVWVFGYGSIIWKPGFEYEKRLVGCIKGFKRRFWLSDANHRGTQEKPGICAVILESDDDEEEVWGVAFKLRSDSEYIKKTLDNLNHRERDGYTRQKLTFYPSNDDVTPAFQVAAYVSTPENPFLLDPETPLKQIAEQIATRTGPSGCNIEYFLRLAMFMKEEVPKEDPHIVALESTVRQITARRG